MFKAQNTKLKTKNLLLQSPGGECLSSVALAEKEEGEGEGFEHLIFEFRIYLGFRIWDLAFVTVLIYEILSVDI